MRSALLVQVRSGRPDAAEPVAPELTRSEAVGLLTPDLYLQQQVTDRLLSCRVVNWIKQIVPQPVILPSGGVPVEAPPKVSRSSLDKGRAAPDAALRMVSAL